LGLAFFQIINALILDCLKEPFVFKDTEIVATTTFGNFVQGICSTSSVNELWFFFVAFDELAVRWNFKNTRVSLCSMCMVRGQKAAMIKCATCTKFFHKTCIPDYKLATDNWECADWYDFTDVVVC
jgi:hypothetical protein